MILQEESRQVFFFEGHFWKRSEAKKRIRRVAQKTQIRAALQELLESLPDRMSFLRRINEKVSEQKVPCLDAKMS